MFLVFSSLTPNPSPSGEGNTAFFKMLRSQYFRHLPLKEGRLLPLWGEGWDGGLILSSYLRYNVPDKTKKSFSNSCYVRMAPSPFGEGWGEVKLRRLRNMS